MKKLHANKPQMEANTIISKIMLLIYARRTGKTSGVGVPKMYKMSKEMPRCRLFWGNPSYTNLYRNTLPEIKSNLENRIGLVEGTHYVMREKPPIGFERAYRPSTDHANTLFFKQGSECNFFSLNFNVINNGDAVDGGFLDEVRFMDQTIINNLLLCLSGTHHSFLNNPYHKSITMMTDMPTDERSDWLFDYEKDMHPDIIQDIVESHYYWQHYKQKLKEDHSQSYHYAIEQKIKYYQENLCKLSNLTTAVLKASTLDNVHVLGIDTIENFMKLLPPDEFVRSVLNIRRKKSNEGFYYELSDQLHGYRSPKVSYISNTKDLDGNQDCNWDNDIDYKQPLKIALDYNSAICTMIVGQLSKNKRELKFLKNLWVERPLKRKHLIEQFHNYYKNLPVREVDFYFDNTATWTDADKTIDESYAAKTVQELESFGWTVNLHYLEKPITHKWTFERWGELLRGSLGLKFSFNLDNCYEWFQACEITKTRTVFLQSGKPKLEKNKVSETRKNFQPIKATHITEAGDGLFKGIMLIDLQFSEDNIEQEFMQVISS